MTTLQSDPPSKSPMLPTPDGELPKSYSPKDAEPKVRAQWDAARAFHADPHAGGGRKPFCIVIPPPNVTAALHLGHAFNNTLQDILTRFHRMKGDTTLWMPGTDHAGIATQAVVEKRLLLQNIKRRDLGREKFVERVQAWKDEYEATIIEQLKLMGCSCDFERTRFTMDEVCAKAVREAFFRLFKDGLIYRGKRLVNWDPVSQTALADDEVEMEEVQGHMYYLRYPLVDSRSDAHGLQSVGVPAHVTVATTRPETMLGDTAVAINPKDPRAAQFVGRKIKLPIVDREIPIIADDYVVRPVQYGGDENDGKAKIATGFLKVTPAHDDNDYQIGQRHNLPIINVFAPDASISDKHGWTDVSAEAQQFIGLSREAARTKIVQWFKDHGLLEDVKPYTHSVGHSYRSHVPIEPYLSDQWYVKVTDDRLRGEALRAMAPEYIAPGMPGAKCKEGDGELHFFPARYAKTFQSWHENIRDWCISRQIWWGHRIPVWSRPARPIDPSNIAALTEEIESLNRWTAEGRITTSLRSNQGTVNEVSETLQQELSYVFVCLRDLQDNVVISRLEKWGYIQDPDVLDTWFSSALWPISTMGWPDPNAFPTEIPEGEVLIDTFNPSTVLFTAREIITLWVSRMVMFNRYFRDGKLPFENVYIHAMIQDGHGQKMSKSLGNGVDPRDIIHSHGADAMRFTLAKLATSTQDVRLPVDMICPHEGCEETFQPKEIVTSAGYRVADAIQTCPKCKRKIVSGFGAASGVATPGPDQPLARNSSRKFDEGRNFATKLWNATRFALSNLKNASASDAHGLQSVGVDTLPLVDKWILSRLHRTLHAVEDAIDGYQFNAYADAMYDFIWRDFCDWYLEAIKPTVKTNPAQQQVLATVLNAALRLLHPIMPFVTETIWPHACAFASNIEGIKLDTSPNLVTALWPSIKCNVDDDAAVIKFERIQGLVNAIRQRRSEHKVVDSKMISLHAPVPVIDLINQANGVVQALAKLKDVSLTSETRPAGGATVSVPFEGAELLLTGLVDAVNIDGEKSRLQKLIAEKEKAVSGFAGRLANEGYVNKAPPAQVDQTRLMLAQAEADLNAARQGLASLNP